MMTSTLIVLNATTPYCTVIASVLTVENVMIVNVYCLMQLLEDNKIEYL